MLTAAQLAALKSHIDADPVLAALPMTHDGAYAVAEALNLASDPAVIVWRTSVTQDEIMQNGFDWTRVDNLNVGAARVWEWMFNNERRTINPSKVNVRAGIDAVWKGTSADLAVRAAVYVHCKRSATRLEALFAVGAGTTESPSTMAVEGRIGYIDVYNARRL